MIVEYIKGDITETELSVIVHGVNCQNVMGSGVAKALFTKWEEVKWKYHAYCEHKEIINSNPDEYYEELLGDVDFVCVERDENDKTKKTIVNAFTQFDYGYDNKKRVSYWAISNCFKYINDFYSGKKIAIPNIGCGLAGGDWDIVKVLIDDATPDIEVYVYEL